MHRPRRAAAWLLAGSLLAPTPALAQEPTMPAEDPWSGTYQVTGLTVDQKSGDTRRIEGHVVLTRKGDAWVAAAELATEYPTLGGPVHTDVIGNGDGQLIGGRLAGTAHTQLVIQTVPGVDTDFAFIPRVVGPRLVSDWTARLDTDGSLLIELSNRGEEGEEYVPTKTTLKGKRVKMPTERKD
jgi:hypothetical protein